MKHLRTQNHYELLGVERTASVEEIHDAYVMGKQAFEPESMAAYSLATEEESELLLKMMLEAYSTLSDIKKRRKYDDALEKKEQKNRRQGGAVAQKNRNPNKTSTGDKKQHPAAAVQRKTAEQFAQAVSSVTSFNGAVLRELRNLRGDTLQQVANKTKVRVLYLRAIEEENIEILPAGIYIKGFVRLYAKELGLPMDKVVTDYIQCLGNSK